MRRRDLFKAAAVAATARADVPTHLWPGHDFGAGPRVADRLNQGPFGVEQDDGWFTIAATTPLDGPLANPGIGMVGYTWEESGPSLAARAGRETVEQHVEKMARLPFVDVLYIRCDWRDVQRQPGKLDLIPVWKLTFDAARQYGKRVAFRVMLSNTVGQPGYLAMPDFVQQRVPIVDIGSMPEYGAFRFREPRYDHPEFQRAVRELTGLLAAEFDGNPLIEWIDLMQYGFWGESHTNSLPRVFPDYLTGERAMTSIAAMQMEAFRRTQLAVNTQPDITQVGNREVIDITVRDGAWLRSDSILVEEPEQIDALANRPAWLASILEDGYFRTYDTKAADPTGLHMLEVQMLHALDLGATHWALWTETDNLARFAAEHAATFNEVRRRIGYRVRPSWIWQRKRYGANELVVCFANDGVAGVPGVLRVSLTTPEGRVIASGCLDAGHPHGGRTRQAAFAVAREWEGKKLQLRAEIELKGGLRKPVKWASRQPAEFTVKNHADPDWRKNV